MTPTRFLRTTADADVCGYWHSRRGQEQSQTISRDSDRAPQADVEITFSVRIVVGASDCSGVQIFAGLSGVGIFRG
jgi:hypothetical protein